MMRKNVEHHQSVFFAATRRYFVTQYDFLAVIMNARPKNKRARVIANHVGHSRIHYCLSSRARTPRSNDGPTGETARNFLDVLLGVAAVDTQRVQLHQFTRIVFINSAALLLLLLRPLVLRVVAHPQIHKGSARAGALLWRLGVRAHALKIIEIEKHRRTLGRGEQQIFKVPENMRPDHVPLVSRDHVTVRALVDKNVEMVVPEIGQHLLELAVAVGGAQQLAFRQIAAHHLHGSGQELNLAAKIRRRIGRCLSRTRCTFTLRTPRWEAARWCPRAKAMAGSPRF